MSESEVWQLQVRKGTDVLWFEQSNSLDHRDVERAAERASEWIKANGVCDAVLFWTKDPKELAQADQGVTP